MTDFVLFVSFGVLFCQFCSYIVGQEGKAGAGEIGVLGWATTIIITNNIVIVYDFNGLIFHG